MLEVHKLSIKEIKAMLEEGSDSQLELLLEKDSRHGVQQLLGQLRKKRDKQRALAAQWEQMCRHEAALREQGIEYIAGMDEVGRGPLAGPVVAAAVILPRDFYLPGLNDSKKVPASLRKVFYEAIISQAVAYSVSFAHPQEIDEINIYQATLKVMRECLMSLSPGAEYCLVDGTEVPGLSVPSTALVGGDGLSVSIAAASIVAKVTRDRWMREASQQYPAYGFDQNAGYGTPSHLAAIAKHGPTPLHRKSFAGVKEWVQG